MPKRDIPQKIRPVRIGLLLVDGFAMMSYATAVEPFRAANVLAGRVLYEWHHLANESTVGQASNGARIMVDISLTEATGLDMVFVFAGGDPRGVDNPSLSAWLRQLHRQGVVVAGISAGPYLLAQSGLLSGRRATIHWEHEASMRSAFPDVILERGLYVMDGRLITCAGGTSGLDLALELIARDHGRELATRVGDWFIRNAPRDASAPQRLDHAERCGLRNRAVREALTLIEGRIDQPPTRDELAEHVGLSVRHLERLFITHLKESIHDIGLGMRLDVARHLLRTTDLKVTDVALECGFVSAPHFSRVFAGRFNMSPSALRRENAVTRLAADTMTP